MLWALTLSPQIVEPALKLRYHGISLPMWSYAGGLHGQVRDSVQHRGAALDILGQQCLHSFKRDLLMKRHLANIL